MLFRKSIEIKKVFEERITLSVQLKSTDIPATVSFFNKSIEAADIWMIKNKIPSKLFEQNIPRILLELRDRFLPYLYKLWKANRSNILSTERKIVIVLDQRVALIGYSPELSNVELVVFIAKPQYIVGNLLYLQAFGKFQPQFIQELCHEADHYLDRKSSLLVQRYQKIIDRFPELRGNAKYLLLILYMLRNEAYTTIREAPEGRTEEGVDVHILWQGTVPKLQKKLEHFVGANVTEEQAEKLFRETYQEERTIHEAAMHLAITITIDNAVRHGIEGNLYDVSESNKDTYSFKDFGTYLERNKGNAWIANLPEQIIKETQKEIGNLDHRGLIQRYEQAARNLHIPKKYWVVWWGWFDDLKKKATRYHEKRKSKLFTK